MLYTAAQSHLLSVLVLQPSLGQASQLPVQVTPVIKHLAFRLTSPVLLETDARFSSLEFFLANLSKMNSKSKKLY